MTIDETNQLDMANRLRKLAILDEVGSNNPLGCESADLIEAQQREIERLRASLVLYNKRATELANARESLIKQAERIAFLEASEGKLRTALARIRAAYRAFTETEPK